MEVFNINNNNKSQSPRVRELEESEELEIGPASGLFSIELKVGISHSFWTETIRAHLWPFTTPASLAYV